ncbi:MAG TPA: hypothetical protein DGR08_03645 [Synechococcales bacterium UBA12195]|nr:hypothetical protein [Synechococcales bacterium UBA12195]
MAMKYLINGAYIAGGIAVAWFIYATIDYQLKRNACLGYHLNRINAAQASRALGREEGPYSPAEACQYYR